MLWHLRSTCVVHVWPIIAVVVRCIQLQGSACVTLVTGVGPTTHLYYNQSNSSGTVMYCLVTGVGSTTRLHYNHSNKLWYRDVLSDNGTRTGDYALYRDSCFVIQYFQVMRSAGRAAWYTTSRNCHWGVTTFMETLRVNCRSKWVECSILPTLLWGKLVDIYMGPDDATRDDFKLLKKPLWSILGLLEMHYQLVNYSWHIISFLARMSMTASELRKFFTESYPSKAMMFTILLQYFMTSLSPPICHQLLLKGQLTTLDDVIKSATGAEYALTLDPIFVISFGAFLYFFSDSRVKE